MRKEPGAFTVRRSFAFPRALVDEVLRLAPPEIGDNLNRAVTLALEDYVARRRRAEFEREMAEMAADPEVRAEMAAIQEEFRCAEGDGLPPW